VKRLEAVIFDWAGTTVDCGSLAPVRAVTNLFALRGIQLSDAEVRRDMGLFKKDHIRRILEIEHVEAEWKKRKGRAAKNNDADLEELFADFTVLQMKILEQHSQLIDGVASLAEKLRGRGLKLGSTTGYTRPMLDLLVARAREQGYRPDLSLCPDDVGGGRPHPWMCLRIAFDFRLSSTATAIKVGDTVSDIQEGLNAGMWTAGVTATGNEVGLSASELAALTPEEYRRRLDCARDHLKAAGAHYVIDSVAQMEQVIEDVNPRLAAGERP
jgi:phosphonoacetaldehyde hydrolase